MITSGELIIFHDLIMYITTFIYKKSIGVLRSAVRISVSAKKNKKKRNMDEWMWHETEGPWFESR